MDSLNTPTPDQFGPFEIIRELGRGSFGVVYLVNDSRNHRQAALKLPFPFVLKSPTIRKRFRREAEIGEKLRHPGIVEVMESGEIGEIIYILSEFIDGQTLGDWLIDFEPIEPRDIALLGYHLADAMAYAHEFSVIHRDLKPSNILMRQRKPDEDSTDPLLNELKFIPAITDFGLARVLNENRNEESWTGSAGVGAPSYMAPEQALGYSDQICPATDIHAIGILMYKLLTGFSPFVGDSREAILRRVISEEPQVPSSLKPDLPKGLNLIISKCLRKNIRSRYRSATALKADLGRYLNGLPPLARRKNLFEKMTSWSRRHPVMATSVIFFFISLFSIITVLATKNRQLTETNDKLAKSNQQLREEQEIQDRASYDRRLADAAGLLRRNLYSRSQEILMEIDKGPGQRDFVWDHLWRRSRSQLELLRVDRNDFHTIAVDKKVGYYQPEDCAIAISNKLNQIASFHEDKTVRIHSMENQQLIGTITNEDASFKTCLMKYSRDELKFYLIKQKVQNSDVLKQNKLRIEIRNKQGQICRINPVIPDAWLVCRVLESPDGKHFIFELLNENSLLKKIITFSIDSGNWVEIPWVQASPNLSLLNDSDHVVFSDSENRLHLKNINRAEFDLILGSESDLIIGPYTSVISGNKLAILHRNGKKISIWNLNNLQSGKPIEISIGDRPMNYLAWAIYEKQLVCVDSMMNGMIVDIETGKSIVLNQNRNKSSKNVPFFNVISPFNLAVVNDRLITYHYSQFAPITGSQQWNMWNGEEVPLSFELNPPDLLNGYMNDCLHLTDEKYLLRFWPEAIPEKQMDQLVGHIDEAWSAIFSPDGQYLVTSSDDSDDPLTIRIWDWKNSKLVRGWKAHSATVSRLAFSPDGKILASCSLGNNDQDLDNLSFWNPENGKLIRHLTEHRNKIYAIGFSPGGKYFASADHDGVIYIRNATDGSVIRKISDQQEDFNEIVFRPGRENQIAISSFRKVQLFDVENGQLITQWDTKSEATSINFSPDGNYLSACEETGRINVWNMADNSQAIMWETEGEKLASIKFIPRKNEYLLAAGDTTGALHIWNFKTDVKSFYYKIHQDKINDIAVTPDGNTVATVSHDGAIQLWRTDPIR
jgi:serine/threonine protein kinase/WD40 repeat protein